MIANIFQNSTIPILQESTNFSQARHNVLVGNIANMDTPGYHGRDLSVDLFQTKLKAAIEAQKSRRASPKSEPESLGITKTEPGDPMREVRDSVKNVLFHDDTDLSLENQITEIAKNQMMHNMAITIMSQQFRLLQTAISERV